MKVIYKLIALVAVFALLLTSCSKDEATSSTDDPAFQSVDLSFGAVLNDLANRAAEVNKNHFDQVPDCSDAVPAFAVIGFSYGGDDYEATVAILSDESGFFTDYSEDLKIPVPNNSSVEVTLNSFMVYDGDPDTDGELIWIAPIASEGEFDGYVSQALPFSFDVSDGTKPYIPVEVLCFDDRMANEYGYVFFDILPEVIYPLCLFVNYCDENGRHFVADYSVDLYFGTDASGIQLYDHLDDNAMANTGDYGDGLYYADPLCLIVPGPPANLASNQPYLYMVLYPNDWDGTGDRDNSPIGGLTLSWDMVSGLLNDDGETVEYWHLLIGECDGALSGDGSGGNGGTGDNDLDDDGIPNNIDQCPNTPDGVNVNSVGCPDTDGDGVFDNDDDCPNEVPDIDEDGDGCEDDSNGGGDPEFTCDFTPEQGCITWDFDQSEANAGIDPNSYDILDGNELAGVATIKTEDGTITVNIAMNFGYLIDDVGVIIDNGTEECRSNLSGSGEELFEFSGSEDQTNVQILLNFCSV